MLARGVVPSELLAPSDRPSEDPLVDQLLSSYQRTAVQLTDSDEQLLQTVRGDLAGLRVSALTYSWAENWVAAMKIKRERPLAPGSIRKRVGALARVLDWHHRQRMAAGATTLPANPLRLLPRGYSQYNPADQRELTKLQRLPAHDQVRDRRLLPAELQRIRAALAGAKREDRERAWPTEPAFVMLFELILATGMRLREAYTLRVDQLDLARGVIRVEGTKARKGEKKPRLMPVRPELRERLQAYATGRVGLLLPFWSGAPADLRRVTNRLSARFGTLFEYAQVPDFTEHDLRHEATCRWFELRDSRGGWTFSEIEVCRIMGWKDTRMALRYASLRGEDLAARLA
jgi:integrase